MKTIFYVGKPYPHKTALRQLQSAGYTLGLLHDRSVPLRGNELFDHVIELDFSSEDAFKESLSTATLPHIDGLLCLYENYIVFKSIAADILSLPSLSIDAAKACTDKYLMRSLFQVYNPAITPEFTHVESKDQLLDFARATGYPLILKPTNLVKSLLVTKCRNEEELLTAYENTLQNIDALYKKQRIIAKPGLILERYVTGKMCSIAAFVDTDGIAHFCDGIVELVTAQDIGYDDNFLYARKLVNDYTPELKGRLFAVAKDGIAALGMRSSPAHVEIIFNDHEIKLVEIGARTGGYRPFLYEQSYGIDMIEQEARIATGQQPELSSAFTRYSSLYELFPRSKSTFVGLKNSSEASDYTYFHQVARTGDIVGRAEDGYRALAIFGIADPDRESFLSQSKAIEQIEVVSQ